MKNKAARYDIDKTLNNVKIEDDIFDEFMTKEVNNVYNSSKIIKILLYSTYYHEKFIDNGAVHKNEIEDVENIMSYFYVGNYNSAELYCLSKIETLNKVRYDQLDADTWVVFKGLTKLYQNLHISLKRIYIMSRKSEMDDKKIAAITCYR